MTWFITERDSSKHGANKYTIAGVDEFRNDAYLSELNKGKQPSVSYNMLESVNSCKGFNDGSYYVSEQGFIKWRSCELLIQPPLPPLSPVQNIGYEGDKVTDTAGVEVIGVRKYGNSVIRISAPEGFIILPDLKKQVEITGNFSVANDHTFLVRRI